MVEQEGVAVQRHEGSSKLALRKLCCTCTNTFLTKPGDVDADLQ